jgi:hypothetical protein
MQSTPKPWVPTKNQTRPERAQEAPAVCRDATLIIDKQSKLHSHDPFAVQ